MERCVLEMSRQEMSLYLCQILRWKKIPHLFPSAKVAKQTQKNGLLLALICFLIWIKGTETLACTGRINHSPVQIWHCLQKLHSNEGGGQMIQSIFKCLKCISGCFCLAVQSSLLWLSKCIQSDFLKR